MKLRSRRHRHDTDFIGESGHSKARHKPLLWLQSSWKWCLSISNLAKIPIQVVFDFTSWLWESGATRCRSRSIISIASTDFPLWCLTRAQEHLYFVAQPAFLAERSEPPRRFSTVIRWFLSPKLLAHVIHVPHSYPQRFISLKVPSLVINLRLKP